MRRVLALLLLAACGSSASTEPPPDVPVEPPIERAAEPAPEKTPANAEPPAEGGEGAGAEPGGPPARGDDATRKSKNGLTDYKLGDVDVSITYGRPEARGRTVWGELVPYGQVWRTGADEATVVTFSGNVKLGAAKVKAGSYALFTIPEADKWTIILNRKAEQWGAYDYDQKQDVARAIVKPRKLEEPVEVFTIEAEGEKLFLKWADVGVAVPLKAAP